MTATWEGDRLRALRQRVKLLQREVADAAKIDRGVYIALENGRRPLTPYYREKIAPVLGVSPEELAPPGEDGRPDDPLLRLAEVEAAVAANVENLDDLQATLAVIRSWLEAQLNELDSRVRALED